MFDASRPFKAVIESSSSYRWLYDLLSPMGEVILAHPLHLRAIAAGLPLIIILVTVLSRRAFPCQTLGMEYDGGWRVLLDFWNMGEARAAPMPDVNADSIDEVMVYGSNNDHQTAWATRLSPIPGGVVRGRSPDGWRDARVLELEAYPSTGASFRFPRSAVSKHPGLMVVPRDTVVRVESGADTGLRFTVQDAARLPQMPQSPLRLEYTIDLAGRTSTVRFVAEDKYLNLMRSLIHSAELEDDWGIDQQQHLGRYGEYLASQVETLDASDPEPAWRRLRQAP